MSALYNGQGEPISQVQAAGVNMIIFSNFNRPNDATQYAVGDLVANSVTAGSVSPLAFFMADGERAGGMIMRARLRKNPSLVNAKFRLHIVSGSPTFNAGDNNPVNVTAMTGYAGSIDITCDQAFADFGFGFGVPNVGTGILVSGGSFRGFLECLQAYTPAANETFMITVDFLA